MGATGAEIRKDMSIGAIGVDLLWGKSWQFRTLTTGRAVFKEFMVGVGAEMDTDKPFCAKCYIFTISGIKDRSIEENGTELKRFI